MNTSELKQIFRPTDRCRREGPSGLPLSDVFDHGVLMQNVPANIFPNGFSKDKDLILFSRPFRRLQHKTQIYPGGMGDHVRTRLTHTLEVARISELLARRLGADEDLAEAIALGHDLGHTPFGHQGERILHEIMSGNGKDVLPDQPAVNHGGFRHNYHGVRLLDIIETKRAGSDGQNLCWQTLEGILKHTATDASKWDLRRFIHPGRNPLSLFPQYPFSVTMEGQIVAAADEIAQRQQDIDDATKNPETRLSIPKARDKLIELADHVLAQRDPGRSQSGTPSGSGAVCQGNVSPAPDACSDAASPAVLLLQKFRDDLKKSKNDKDLYPGDYLIRRLMEYFLTDVCHEADSRCLTGGAVLVKTHVAQNLSDASGPEQVILQKKIIDLSPVGKDMDREIRKWIGHRITNTPQINVFDERSGNALEMLFRALYKNPRQLPSYETLRLEGGLKKNAGIFDIHLKISDAGCCRNASDAPSGGIRLTDVRFSSDSGQLVDQLVRVLKLKDIAAACIVPEGVDLSVFSDADALNRLIEKPVAEMDDCERFIRCCLENNNALLTCICNYIAGMTDNYATKEYRKFYLLE